MTASTEVVQGISQVLDNLQICAPRPAQQALASQILELDHWIAENNSMIAERADAFQKVISESPGWVIKSLGAYFAYVEHPFGDSSASLVKKMASEYGILPLPGSFFGNDQDRYLRMAFANADKDTIFLLKQRLALLE